MPDTPDILGGALGTLRHFYASALIAGGASVKQAQLVLGHTSAVIDLWITRTRGREKKTAPGP